MHYARFTEHDVDDVIKFLVDDPDALQPTMTTLRLGKEESLAIVKSLLPEAIASGLSYVVKINGHEVVGVRLSTFRTRPEAVEEALMFTDQDLSTLIGQTQSLLRALNQQFWAQISPDINRVYYLMAVLVSSKYRRTDLADNLIHHNMDEIRTMGADGLLADAAIFHSHLMLQKFEYRVVAEVDRATFFKSCGRPSLQEANESDKAQLVFKEMWRGENPGASLAYG